MLSKRLILIASVALLTGASPVTTAAAAPDPKPTTSVGSCSFMEICVGAGVEGSQESPASTGANKGGKGGKSGKPDPHAPVCTVQKLVPPPPAGSSLWEGHDPGKGAVYTRACVTSTESVGLNANTTVDTFWAATPPPAVDPAVLAQQALDKMLLKGPDIDINPKPGGKGLVRMPVWMAADPSQTTWGPNTASASAGGVTVTATATVSQVVWDMGDGTSVTCTGPGTVYKTSYGLKKSPDCGHAYTQPSSKQQGGKYKVTATSTWTVDWQVAGGGETGQLTAVRQSTVALTIVESQAVNES